MEEEKKKQQRESMESASRPSLDSLGAGRSGTGGGDDSIDLAPNAPPAATMAAGGAQPRRSSFGRDDGTDANRAGLLQPLATVAERKSEYGFDGLNINPGSGSSSPLPLPETPKIGIAREPSHRKPAPPTLAHPQPQVRLQQPTDPDPIDDSSSVRAPESEPAKRYSSSPKLPDLSRLSGFGSDFFSGPGDLLSGAPSAIQEDMPADNVEAVPEPGSGSAGSAGSKSKKLLPDTPQQFSINAEAPVPETVTHQTRPLALTSPIHPTDSSAALDRQPQPQSKPFRPSLPGSWVSETATPGEMATPAYTASEAAGGLAINSPISEGEEDSSHIQPPAPPIHSSGGKDLSDSDSDSDTRSEKSERELPPTLAPLRITPSPSKDDGGFAPPPPPHKDQDLTPGRATSVLPPAPLQPRKGEEPSQRLPITRVETTSTMDNTSPMGESDVLRDEIMRSLSPIGPSNEHLNIAGGRQGSAGPSDDPFTRESAYLDDVYGDYWSGGQEKKPQTGSPGATPTAETPAAVLNRPSSPEQTQPVAIISPPVTEPLTETGGNLSESERPAPRVDRFSWEAGSEKINSTTPGTLSTPGAPSPAKTALPISPSVVVAPPQLSPETAAPDEDTSRSAPVLDSNDTSQLKVSTGDNILSHEVLQASTARPLSASMEPPSPVSVTPEPVAAENVPLPRDSGSHRFSLDQAAPGPITSESPTRDEQPLPSAPADLASRSRGSSDVDKVPVMNFKDIMALPSSNERISKYVATRTQFAAMDSGLDDWLEAMASGPEHANASDSFSYAMGGLDVPLPLSSTTGGQQHPQLNASSSNVHAPPNLRPTGSMSSGQQLGLSDFKHTSAQVGTKGKDLLFAAGKAGKGLLSKGKNKLKERQQQRGSGDKVFF